MNRKKLEEICLIQAGGTPSRSKSDYWINGEIPWIKISDIKSKYIYKSEEFITEMGLNNSSAKIIKKGSILYTIFATLGEVGILQFDATTNQAIAGLTLTNDEVDIHYLYYYLKSLKTLVNNMGRGVAQNNINLKILKSFEIPLPTLEEQYRVVKKLEVVENLLNKKKDQLNKLDELIKSRFVELMQTYPSNNLLEEFISAYKAERCGDREIPVLSITKEDGIVFQSKKFKKRIASVDASTYKVVPRGKLVQGIHIDERNFAIQNIADEGIVSPAYKIWNVNEDKVIPEVLAYAMRTDRTMAYISSKFTGSVKRRESISMNDFMATPIDLPNIKVQTEFYNFMKQTDKSKFEIQKSIDELQTLFDSLMQEYFG